ncbi:Uncharacterized protein PBTT_01311 [Plasmodiophora brassicae]|nr:hypothetical protein PBRA_001481 [Plasmodiophora brassicae]
MDSMSWPALPRVAVWVALHLVRCQSSVTVVSPADSVFARGPPLYSPTYNRYIGPQYPSKNTTLQVYVYTGAYCDNGVLNETEVRGRAIMFAAAISGASAYCTMENIYDRFSNAGAAAVIDLALYADTSQPFDHNYPPIGDRDRSTDPMTYLFLGSVYDGLLTFAMENAQNGVDGSM